MRYPENHSPPAGPPNETITTTPNVTPTPPSAMVSATARRRVGACAVLLRIKMSISNSATITAIVAGHAQPGTSRSTNSVRLVPLAINASDI